MHDEKNSVRECVSAVRLVDKKSFLKEKSKQPTALLRSNAPNFKFDRRIIERHRLCEKSRTNGGFLKFKEFVPHEPYDEARLAHGCIAQQDQFEVMHSAVRSVDG